MLPKDNVSLPFIEPFSFRTWMGLIALLVLYSFILYFLSFLAKKWDDGTVQQDVQYSVPESFLHFFFISIQVSHTYIMFQQKYLFSIFLLFEPLFGMRMMPV